MKETIEWRTDDPTTPGMYLVQYGPATAEFYGHEIGIEHWEINKDGVAEWFDGPGMVIAWAPMPKGINT